MATEWTQIIPPRSQYDKHGLRERRLSTGFYHVRIGFSADPLKDDDWARRHALTYGGFDSPLWRREQGIDYHAYAGQRIWPMFSQGHHNQYIPLKDLIEKWTLFRIIDQGIRHPTVCLWVAVNADGDRHFYREYYSTNKSIAMNCAAIKSLTQDEPVVQTFIDPAAKKRNEETLKTAIQVYEENGVFCDPADNSFVGYDSVTNAALTTLARYALRTGTIPNYFNDLNPDQKQLLTIAEQPAVTFDLRYTSRCFSECCNLRWQEAKGDITQTGPKERPVDVEDDGPDCVRYAVRSPLYHRARAYETIKIMPLRKIMELRRKKKHYEDIRKKQENRYAVPE